MAEDVTKQDLEEAVQFARRRVQTATDEYHVGGRTLLLLRSKQVAEDELKALLKERRDYDADRSVASLRQLDQHRRRA